MSYPLMNGCDGCPCEGDIFWRFIVIGLAKVGGFLPLDANNSSTPTVLYRHWKMTQTGIKVTDLGGGSYSYEEFTRTEEIWFDRNIGDYYKYSASDSAVGVYDTWERLPDGSTSSSSVASGYAASPITFPVVDTETLGPDLWIKEVHEVDWPEVYSHVRVDLSDPAPPPTAGDAIDICDTLDITGVEDFEMDDLGTQTTGLDNDAIAGVYGGVPFPGKNVIVEYTRDTGYTAVKLTRKAAVYGTTILIVADVGVAGSVQTDITFIGWISFGSPGSAGSSPGEPGDGVQITRFIMEARKAKIAATNNQVTYLRQVARDYLSGDTPKAALTGFINYVRPDAFSVVGQVDGSLNALWDMCEFRTMPAVEPEEPCYTGSPKCNYEAPGIVVRPEAGYVWGWLYFSYPQNLAEPNCLDSITD